MSIFLKMPLALASGIFHFTLCLYCGIFVAEEI